MTHAPTSRRTGRQSSRVQPNPSASGESVPVEGLDQPPGTTSGGGHYYRSCHDEGRCMRRRSTSVN